MNNSVKKALNCAKECVAEAFAYTDFMPLLLIEQLFVLISRGTQISMADIDYELTKYLSLLLVDMEKNGIAVAPKVMVSIANSIESKEEKKRYTLKKHMKMRKAYVKKYRQRESVKEYTFKTKATFIEVNKKLIDNQKGILEKAVKDREMLKETQDKLNKLTKNQSKSLIKARAEHESLRLKLEKTEKELRETKKIKSLQLDIDHAYIRKHEKQIAETKLKTQEVMKEKLKLLSDCEELSEQVARMEEKLIKSENEAKILKDCLDKKEGRELEDIEYILEKADVNNLSKLLHKIKKSKEVKELEEKALKVERDKWKPLGLSVQRKINTYVKSKEPKALSFIGLVDTLNKEEKLALLNRVNSVTKHENLDKVKQYPKLVIRNYDKIGDYLDGLANRPRELMQFSMLDSSNMFKLINRTSWMINTIVKSVYGYSSWNANYYYLKSYNIN